MCVRLKLIEVNTQPISRVYIEDLVIQNLKFMTE